MHVSAYRLICGQLKVKCGLDPAEKREHVIVDPFADKNRFRFTTRRYRRLTIHALLLDANSARRGTNLSSQSTSEIMTGSINHNGNIVEDGTSRANESHATRL